MVSVAAPRSRSGGPEGNERLTAAAAVILLVLLAVEGVTIVFLGPLLPVHLFVGMLLLGPVALKLASTGYRFARYYGGSEPYRRRGAPPTPLRVIAPVVVLSTVAVMATGVALLITGPAGRGALLPLHKVSFIVWIAFTGIHVLGHLTGLPRPLRADYGPRHGGAASGRAGREMAAGAALAAGAVIAVAVLPLFGAWTG